MKTLTILFLALLPLVACAAILEGERDLGNGFKLCMYDDGSAFTVKDWQLCPLSH